ncbi:MAG TPA: hypothetical protein VFA12_08075 [Stellaceae bacterium]|nr:hypothetical protein [Stellaceae bacterium]
MPTADDLAAQYALLNDNALRALVHGSGLADDAQAIAAAELRRRGVDTVARAPQPPAQRGGPRLPPVLADGWRVVRAPVLWIYFGALAAWLAAGTAALAREGAYSSRDGLFAAIVLGSTAADLLALLGIYGYLRNARIITAGFWQVLFVIETGKIVLGGGYFLARAGYFLWMSAFHPYDLAPNYRIPIYNLAGMLCWAPLIIGGLFVYAFRSPALWRRPRAL